MYPPHQWLEVGRQLLKRRDKGDTLSIYLLDSIVTSFVPLYRPHRSPLIPTIDDIPPISTCFSSELPAATTDSLLTELLIDIDSTGTASPAILSLVPSAAARSRAWSYHCVFVFVILLIIMDFSRLRVWSHVLGLVVPS